MKRLLLLVGLIFFQFRLLAQNDSIEKVFVVFKTHLDVGFTNYSSAVTQNYLDNFIPKALAVAEELRAENSEEKYVWTVGSWLIWKYLQKATLEETERLTKAISAGDIVWNGVPYTVESEVMNKEMFESSLLLAKKLDKRFQKHTIAAKMTDVPGHTRSIIAPLCKAGFRFLHIGVNPSSAVPKVPNFCRWQDTEGNEIILAYQQDYGSEDVLPDGKTAISINFTGDNHGPHSVEKVKRIYADLHKRYPNARLVAASFNEIAEELYGMKSKLPIVTSEIGDTWIYGYGSEPLRMAKYRGISNLYANWIREGKLNEEDDTTLNFVAELGLIAEHTWGMDVKTHLKNWDKYDMEVFNAARSLEAFQRMEHSWRELDQYIDNALTYLPDDLRCEAEERIAEVEKVEVPDWGKHANSRTRPWALSLGEGKKIFVPGLFYQMYNETDYINYRKRYQRGKYDWAIADFGKPGLGKSGAVHASVQAEVVKERVKKMRGKVYSVYELAFPEITGIDKSVYPERMWAEVYENNKKGIVEIDLTIWNKPAVRLPEAYWLSFDVDNILSIVAEKIGQRVDVFDVVERGNRQMHGIDRYIDLITSAGTLRILSETAFLVNIGEAGGLNYSIDYPDKQGGIHFNLNNNLWGTNFSMWNEGSLTYHFVLEWID